MNKKIIKHKLYIFFSILFLVFIKFSTNNVLAKNYIVSNIEISEIYDLDFNKDKVIDKGFQKAFKDIISKLVQSNDEIIFRNVKIKEIKTLIDNFSITDEKFIDNKYKGIFSVEFNKSKIIDYIQSKNVLPSIPLKTEVLIVPILVNADSSELFYFNQNIFFDIWHKNIKNNFLLQYNLPNKDIEDYQILKKNINSLEDYNFQEILKKYNFENIIILIINKNQNILKVLSKIKFYDQIFLLNETYENLNFDNEKNVENIVNKLKIIYDDKWKIINIINQSISLPILIKINSQRYQLTERFEKTLKKLELVDTFYIEKINSKEIIYRIAYNGMPKKFLKDMKKNNFKLDISNTMWILK